MRAFNIAALALFLLFIFFIGDVLFGSGKASSTIQVVRGDSAPMSGTLNGMPFDPRELKDGNIPPAEVDRYLAYRVDSPNVTLTFTELKGRIWHGRVHVAEGTAPGGFALTVYPIKQNEPDREPFYTVAVYANAADLTAERPTLSERYLGVNPLLLCIGSLFLCAGALYASHQISGRRQEELRARGVGPIYKLARRKDHWEVVFGLGSRQGISQGQTLSLVDRERRVVGRIVAATVSPESTESSCDLEADIRADYLVVVDPGRAARASA